MDWRFTFYTSILHIFLNNFGIVGDGTGLGRGPTVGMGPLHRVSTHNGTRNCGSERKAVAVFYGRMRMSIC